MKDSGIGRACICENASAQGAPAARMQRNACMYAKTTAIEPAPARLLDARAAVVI